MIDDMKASAARFEWSHECPKIDLMPEDVLPELDTCEVRAIKLKYGYQSELFYKGEWFHCGHTSLCDNVATSGYQSDEASAIEQVKEWMNHNFGVRFGQNLEYKYVSFITHMTDG
jgi:hypothetical protein